jgi:hypothetical protein
VSRKRRPKAPPAAVENSVRQAFEIFLRECTGSADARPRSVRRAEAR